MMKPVPAGIARSSPVCGSGTATWRSTTHLRNCSSTSIGVHTPASGRRRFGANVSLTGTYRQGIVPLNGHLLSRGVDAVFRALADPTRRKLLDELFREDGQTLRALEEHLSMTRFGVM